MSFVTRAFTICVTYAATAGAQRARPTGTVIASNMNDNTASVIAVEHATVARTLDLGDHRQPHGVAFLPGDSVLAVTSQASNALLLVDVRTGAVLRVIPSGGRVSHMVSLSARGDRVVLSNVADNTISSISLSPPGDAVVYPVARQPGGIAIAPDGNSAWVGSNRDSVVLVVNTHTGVATDTLRGFGLPYRMALSPDGRTAVVTDPMDATVRTFDARTKRQRASIVIPRDSLVPTAEVPGSPSPEGVTITPDSRWAFVTLQGRNRLVTIDLERGAIVGWAVTGTRSDGVAYSPRVVK